MSLKHRAITAYAALNLRRHGPAALSATPTPLCDGPIPHVTLSHSLPPPPLSCCCRTRSRSYSDGVLPFPPPSPPNPQIHDHAAHWPAGRAVRCGAAARGCAGARRAARRRPRCTRLRTRTPGSVGRAPRSTRRRSRGIRRDPRHRPESPPRLPSPRVRLHYQNNPPPPCVSPLHRSTCAPCLQRFVPHARVVGMGNRQQATGSLALFDFVDSWNHEHVLSLVHVGQGAAVMPHHRRASPAVLGPSGASDRPACSFERHSARP